MTHEQVSHRDNPLRKLQTTFQGQTPGIVSFMSSRGWLDGTAIDAALSQGETLHPDHLTLAGLQLTIESSRLLVNNGDYRLAGKTVLGGVLDGLDGMLARHLNLSSPEGAINDVIADRAGDNYTAYLIAGARSKYDGSAADLEEQLRVSFNLSTLTKAASEMFGVHTSEGGSGSMLQRRRILLFTLRKLGQLNRNPNLKESSRQKLLSDIDAKTEFLISSSHQRAMERIKQIKDDEWNHHLLDEPNSPAAVEARKYAAVALMNQRTGLDMVNYMNGLAGEEIFPAPEYLIGKYDYIGDSLKKTENFLNQALALAKSE